MGGETEKVYTPSLIKWIVYLVVIIFSAVFGTLCNFYIAWGGFAFAMGWEFNFVPMAFGITMVVALINKLVQYIDRRYSLNSADLALLYGALSVGLPVGGVWFHRMNLAPLWGTQFRPPWKDWVAPYIKKHWYMWTLPPDLISPALYGGASPPWGALMGPIVYWSLYVIGLYALTTSLALIVRRRWLDVERLTFPLGQVVAVAVSSAAGTGVEDKRRWKIVFGIAGIMWLLVEPITIINSFRPGTIVIPPGPIPDFGIWNFLNLSWGSFAIPWNLNRYAGWWTYALPRVPLCFGPIPLQSWVAILYLVPLDVLYTALLFFFIFDVIYPMVCVWAGWLPVAPPVDHPYYHQRIWLQNNGSNPAYWNPLMPWVMFGLGGLAALFLMPMALGWKDIVASFRCITKPSAIEQREPIPYRYAYGMFIGGLILLLILWGVAGANVLLGFLILIVGCFYTLGSSRIRGEAGFTASIITSPNFAYGLSIDIGKAFVFPGITPETPPTQMGQAFYTNMHLAYVTVGQPGCSTTLNFPAMTLESMKVADLTGMHLRHQFIANTVAMLITIFTTLFLTYHLAYTVGIMNAPGYRFWFSSVAYAVRPSADGAPAEPYWHLPPIGFLIIAAMFWARLRYPWFILNPAGAVFGTSFILGQNVMPICVLIATIGKWLTFKIGGTKVYENYGVPVATGLIVGWLLKYFTGYLVNVILYVAPWLRVT